MQTMDNFACDTGSLGLSFFSSPSSNYTVNANGRQVDPAELFNQSFLTGRTRELVEAVVKNLNSGATVHPDGSVTIANASGSVFRTAQPGSVIVAKYKQLYPAPTATAMGVPINYASPALKATAAASTPPTAAQVVPGGTPVSGAVTARVETAQQNTLGSTIGTVLNIGLDLFSSSQQVKVAQAQAKAAQAQAAAATASPVFNPPTGTAQGAATNTSAAYGYGFSTTGGGVSRAPAQAPLSLPSLPGLPPAPGSIPTTLPGTGYVQQPAMFQSLSPTTGLSTPVFPGIPATSETGDGKVNLNAASLSRLMADTANDRQAMQLPPPSGSAFPWKIAAGVAVAGLAAYLIMNRRGGRRRR